MNELVRIPFHGNHILAVDVDGTPMVAMKPVCEQLGIQWEAQLKRLKRQPWTCMSVMDTQLPGDTQSRAVTFVDRRTFTMWLATIETSRLKNEATKNLLTAYQREAADALDAYFNEGAAINPRATEHQVNALIRQSQMRMELLQAAKGLIHKDHLEAKARVVMAQGLGEAPQLDPARTPLYTQDFLREKNLSAKKLRSISGTFGKRVKAAYILEHGEDPKKYHLNLANGQTRAVNAYTEADRPLMETVFKKHYAAPEKEIAA